jgi:malonyl-CoA O-methyltransferase
MHEVGDALVQAGFVDPVLDVERITVSYRHPPRAIEDLLASGFWFPPSLTAADKARLCVESPIKTLTYEVIYAHAFLPAVETLSSEGSGVTKIPLSQVRRALKNSC